jgi:23S rRNA (cytosine1962-C5)-methyltransferase
VRGLEGLDDVSAILTGAIDAPIPVQMNGATYMADLTGGQKPGLFYDQRPNHAFVAKLAKGTEVLDVFSHVGGFGLAALAGGANSALAVDGSDPALALAQQGAEAMGVTDKFETRKGDAFDVLAALAEEGRTFGTVICDPPAFAPSKPSMDAGLRAYERVARLATPLVAPGGTLTLCSCSHAVGLDAFRASSIRGIGRAGGQAQVLRTGFAGPDHPLHPALAESGYLKALTLRLLP